jgi:diguanylate cyclase (GGDEF)-like protein/PAS domain S-box-containing protein
MLPNLAARLFTLTGDLVCVTAPDGYFLLLNPAFESSLGYTRLELLTKPFLSLVPEEDREVVREATTRLAGGQAEVYFDVPIRTKQGGDRWFAWHAVPEKDGSVYFIGRDVSERRAEREELRRLSDDLKRLAITDELTGLLNRRGFTTLATHQAAVARRHSWPVVVFALDLDGLKQMNDRGGHHVGDAALRAVADALRAVLRESDVVGRMGGDEFAVMLVNATEDATASFEARLTAALGQRQGNGSESDYAGVPLSLSIGSASCGPLRRWSLDDLMRRADAAMYARKRRSQASRSA